MPKVLSPAPHVFLIFLVLFLELTPCSPFMLLPASRAGSLGFVCAGSASRDLDLRDLDLWDLPPIAGAVGSVQEVWLTIHCSGRPVCNRRRLGLTGSD